MIGTSTVPPGDSHDPIGSILRHKEGRICRPKSDFSFPSVRLSFYHRYALSSVALAGIANEHFDGLGSKPNGKLTCNQRRTDVGSPIGYEKGQGAT